MQGSPEQLVRKGDAVMRKIMVVNPNTTEAMTHAIVAAARRIAGPNTVISGGTPSHGVASVESNIDEIWAGVGVAELVTAGELESVDAYVIACFGDTGLAAAKELAAGPVVGMTEAALTTAALIAHRFTIVTLPRRTRSQSERVVRYLGLDGRCTLRAVEEPVAALHEGSMHLLEIIAQEALTALTDDHAEAIVLGCAGLADLVAPLQERLGVPVIDGVAAAVTMAEGLLAQGLTTSRRSTYATPDRIKPEIR
ncbi:MAG: Hydantoin racemase [Pseudonocardiales bacterium]|nr:Hydantoin racemase [Pseudonocardiales bacterium]